MWRPISVSKICKIDDAIKDLDSVSERGKRTVYQGLKTTEWKKLLFSFVFGKFLQAKDFIKNKL